MMEITSKSMLHLSTVSRLFDNVLLCRVYIEGYSIIIYNANLMMIFAMILSNEIVLKTILFFWILLSVLLCVQIPSDIL